MAVVTLEQLQADARSLADQVNSQFVSDDELTSFINKEYAKVYDLMVTTWGEDYYVANPIQFVSVAQQNLYPLPDGILYAGAPIFYRLLGIDMALPGQVSSPDDFVTLYRFNFAERNRGSIIPYFNNINRPIDFRYRVKGNSLWLQPIPNPGTTFQIWYVPGLVPLAAPSDQTVELQTGWDDLISIGAAIRMKVKGQEDISELVAARGDEYNRLKSTVPNRDAATPSTIVDAYAAGSALGMGYGPGYGGCY